MKIALIFRYISMSLSLLILLSLGHPWFEIGTFLIGAFFWTEIVSWRRQQKLGQSKAEFVDALTRLYGCTEEELQQVQITLNQGFLSFEEAEQAAIAIARAFSRTSGNHFLKSDPTCLFNAQSSKIRCAVNPSGPCEGCKDYEPRLEK